jgi:hypothetical protein
MSGSAPRSVSHHRLDAWGAALLGSSAMARRLRTFADLNLGVMNMRQQ